MYHASLIFTVVHSVYVCFTLKVVVYLYTGTAQQHGDIRLMHGSTVSKYFGRLEIYDGNQWGTICMVGFNITSANTACKQLGSAGAESFDLAERLG